MWLPLLIFFLCEIVPVPLFGAGSIWSHMKKPGRGGKKTHSIFEGFPSLTICISNLNLMKWEYISLTTCCSCALFPKGKTPYFHTLQASIYQFSDSNDLLDPIIIFLNIWTDLVVTVLFPLFNHNLWQNFDKMVRSDKMVTDWCHWNSAINRWV